MRVRIVDFNHIAWRYAQGQGTRLSAKVSFNGRVETVDTTIQTGAIKFIWRLSKHGVNPVIVCFDGKGCSDSRKAYFTREFYHLGVTSEEEVRQGTVGYKARREPQSGNFYTAITMTQNLLARAGVPVLQMQHFEADDLIKVAVDAAKLQFPGVPIDIITGDHDLLPLVDDTVSVFLRSVKTTFAERTEDRITHYVQVTPSNYQQHLETLSAYKTSKLQVPYNTVLLSKLLRGDKSDEIPPMKDAKGKTAWTPKKYNALLEELAAKGTMDFRYGIPTKTYYDATTGAPLGRDEAFSMYQVNKDSVITRFGNPQELDYILDALRPHLDEHGLLHVEKVYNGINLNCAFMDEDEVFRRKPIRFTTDIQRVDGVALQKAVSVIGSSLD